MRKVHKLTPRVVILAQHLHCTRICLWKTNPKVLLKNQKLFPKR